MSTVGNTLRDLASSARDARDDVLDAWDSAKSFAKGTFRLGTGNVTEIFGGLVKRGTPIDPSTAPAFIQPVIQAEHTQTRPGGLAGKAIAHVNPFTPESIYIDEPQNIDPSILAHEETHAFQDRLQGSFWRGMQQIPYHRPDVDYDFGHWQGLIDAHAKGSTIGSFTDEQQATMIEEYTKLQQEIHDPDFKNYGPQAQQYKLQQWDLANRALAPYLKQLTGQPKLDEPGGGIFDVGSLLDVRGLFKPKVLDLVKERPTPPTPPAEETGVMKPLPEIGGSSVEVDPKAVHYLEKMHNEFERQKAEDDARWAQRQRR